MEKWTFYGVENQRILTVRPTWILQLASWKDIPLISDGKGKTVKMRGILQLSLIVVLLLVFGVAGTALAGSNWKEEQAKMFAQIQVKPGDTIDSSNYQKVNDVLPPSIVEWIKNGDLSIKIGELKYDFTQDQEYLDASAKNEGKYVLDDNKSIIDKATGNIPTFIYGNPYPNIDKSWKDDPDAGVKIQHNCHVRNARKSSGVVDYQIHWVNKTAMERSLVAWFKVYYYYNRLDGEQRNPLGMNYLELYKVKEPADLNGMMTLSKRYLDQRTDEYFAYVPAIRRVKKMSGAARSDPFAGSDFVLDDTNGWEGKNETMKWKILEQKIILMPMQENTVDSPFQGVKQPNGAWAIDKTNRTVQTAWEAGVTKGAAYMPVNVVWVPRLMYLIEGMPLDRFYNYGRQILYTDLQGGNMFKIAYDKALKYWKTLITVPVCAEWGEPKKRTIVSRSWFGIVDDKTQHSSTCHYMIPTLSGENARHYYADPSIVPAEFSETMMGSKSR
ncbi:MAG: DUF1329 domain-containing protein [Syntrophobacteraceae bacterium]